MTRASSGQKLAKKTSKNQLTAQGVPLTAVVQVAVREYLGERGYLPSTSALRIRPAKRGSGRDDVSVSHDQYLSSSSM